MKYIRKRFFIIDFLKAYGVNSYVINEVCMSLTRESSRRPAWEGSPFILERKAAFLNPKMGILWVNIGVYIINWEIKYTIFAPLNSGKYTQYSTGERPTRCLNWLHIWWLDFNQLYISPLPFSSRFVSPLALFSILQMGMP